MSESWAYKEIVGILASEASKEEPKKEPPLTGYSKVLADSLDDALDVVGRSGREVLYGILENRYGLKPADIPTKTGTYMSALRDMLGSSAPVVEKYILTSIAEKTGVKAHTLEEAVSRLKERYPDESPAK